MMWPFRSVPERSQSMLERSGTAAAHDTSRTASSHRSMIHPDPMLSLPWPRRIQFVLRLALDRSYKDRSYWAF
eukprot:7909270-Pyramimonas_sp.AAC.1